MTSQSSVEISLLLPRLIITTKRTTQCFDNFSLYCPGFTFANVLNNFLRRYEACLRPDFSAWKSAFDCHQWQTFDFTEKLSFEKTTKSQFSAGVDSEEMLTRPSSYPKTIDLMSTSFLIESKMMEIVDRDSWRNLSFVLRIRRHFVNVTFAKKIGIS